MTGLRKGRLIQRSVSFSILHRFLLVILIISLIFPFLRGKCYFMGQISPQSTLLFLSSLEGSKTSKFHPVPITCYELACLQITCSESLPYQQPCLRFPSITAKLVLPAHFLHLFIEFSVAAAHSPAQAPVGMVTS